MVSSISLVAFNTLFLKHYMNKYIPKTSPSFSSQLLDAKVSLPPHKCNSLVEFLLFVCLFCQVLTLHRLSKPQFWSNSIKAPLFFQKWLHAFFLEKQGFPLSQTLLTLHTPCVLGNSATGEIPITPYGKTSHPTPTEVT